MILFLSSIALLGKLFFAGAVLLRSVNFKQMRFLIITSALLVFVSHVLTQSSVDPDSVIIKRDTCEPIRGLEPEILFNMFCGISLTPRASYKPQKITEFLYDFANKHGFKKKVDGAGNVVINVPASPGYEQSSIVCLQSHVDMVTEKDPDKEFDFDNDAIELIRDGNYLKANKTTLGADNGLGMAISLAAAVDPSIKHGPLELLFTTDEEVGLLGAAHVNENLIKAKLLFNIDGALHPMLIGCAGGKATTGKFILKPQTDTLDIFEDQISMLIISGLKGGHSGVDIHRQRANAIKLLARTLNKLVEQQIDFHLITINGGTWDNAIPRAAIAELHLVNEQDNDKIQQICQTVQKEFLLEYGTTDPDLEIRFKSTQRQIKYVLDRQDTLTLVRVLTALPHGFTSFTQDHHVQTSTNLASIKTIKGDDFVNVTIVTSQRSDFDSARDDLSASIQAVYALANAKEIDVNGVYPGWAPNPNSDLLKVASDVYKDQFGKDIETYSVHAGLEAGIIRAQFTRETAPDVIAFGIEIFDAHSPKERFIISEFQDAYEFTKRMLEKLK
jgi:dipeptidase D